jgi:hypothetical protein
MKVFQDLELKGDNRKLVEALASLRAWSAPHWKHDADSANHLNKQSLGTPPLDCYEFSGQGELPAASLWLIHDERASSIRVTNIVPREVGELTYDEYNAILNEFYSKLAGPVSQRFGLSTNLSASEVDIEQWLSPKAARLLRAFSQLANKSSGSSHPMDRDRWFAFVVESHLERAKLTSSELRRWLIEHEHWGDSKAWDLSIQYEFGRDLLDEYDKLR